MSLIAMTSQNVKTFEIVDLSRQTASTTPPRKGMSNIISNVNDYITLSSGCQPLFRRIVFYAPHFRIDATSSAFVKIGSVLECHILSQKEHWLT